MAGNAMEEGLLGQIANPSHLDRGRIIVPAAAVCGIIAGLIVRYNLPVASPVPAVLVGAVVCGLVAWRLACFFQRRDGARAAELREAARKRQVEDTERALARMKERSS